MTIFNIGCSVLASSTWPISQFKVKNINLGTSAYSLYVLESYRTCRPVMQISSEMFFIRSRSLVTELETVVTGSVATHPS